MHNLFLILSGPLSLFCDSSERVRCVVFVFGHGDFLICIFSFENLALIQIDRRGLVLVAEKLKEMQNIIFYE
jgi:hypothetical protein